MHEINTHDAAIYWLMVAITILLFGVCFLKAVELWLVSDDKREVFERLYRIEKEIEALKSKDKL